MISTIVSGGLKAVVWSLAVIGLAGLVLAGLIASLRRRVVPFVDGLDQRRAHSGRPLDAPELTDG
jgi:hypothetical protein